MKGKTPHLRVPSAYTGNSGNRVDTPSIMFHLPMRCPQESEEGIGLSITVSGAAGTQTLQPH